ncbi:MAG: type IX secretion system sortase PorU [Bacteroidales bacterium]
MIFSDGERLALRFSGAEYSADNEYLPAYTFTAELTPGQKVTSVHLENGLYEPLTSEEAAIIRSTDLPEEPEVRWLEGTGAGKPMVSITIIPLRKNSLTGFTEKLLAAGITIETTGQAEHKSAQDYTYHSVLENGIWHKIAVDHDGIYRISYQFLSSIGMNPAAIDPSTIQLYGLPGGLLPENPGDPRYDDLQELAIMVVDGGDGHFDQNDYILFYGQGPERPYLNLDRDAVMRKIHPYSDYTYYFITAGQQQGKRIATVGSAQSTPAEVVSDFTEFIHYEPETYNLIKSGREWFGDKFDLYNQYEWSYNLPGKITGQIRLSASVAARSDMTSSFTFYVNNQSALTLTVPSTSSSSQYSDYARVKTGSADVALNGNSLTLKLYYNKPLNSSTGWLDYFNINYQRDLSFDGGFLQFNDLRHNSGQTLEYEITKANQNMKVWQVTDPLNVRQREYTLNGTTATFRVSDTDSEVFVLSDGTSYSEPAPAGTIANQNLHGLEDVDYVIVSHPAFADQAERLAQFHRDTDDMSVVVVTPAQIYNEFSSGAQDVSAIRDFMKMLYDRRDPQLNPLYLLLFGDASFDYKERAPDNTNFVPTWTTTESLNPISSYIKDDFFVLLDGAGDLFLDAGVGRFPVHTYDQAVSMVDKTIHYATPTPAVMGDWRNIICLVADDEDGNLHLGDAEEIADTVESIMPGINIDKIYFDSYPQVSTPSGERYPDANFDLNQRINRGALIVNYIGHGGEGGLAHERVVQIADINSWDNYDNMPVFVTATCEFSRFDDPTRTSAGELVALNPNGSGVALFTTTRATYAGANMQLTKHLYSYALQKEDGHYPRMGDVLRLSKNATGNVENKSKFSLLGDPALHFAFPANTVATLSMTNSKAQAIDTIKALLQVTVSGEILDAEGNKMDNFNGTLYPTVYDKPTVRTTLGNDPASYPTEFELQNNILYKGKVDVLNGLWSFTFIAPKDLAYQYGFGKISYYARNDSVDCTGYYTDVVIGGYNEDAGADYAGPELKLYLNDRLFENGGITDENPVLLADVFDESGINTVGNGIGHDLRAILDGSESFVLNDFYESNLNDYKSGSITHPFYNLAEGHHQVSVRVWDSYNNSTVATLDFLVVSGSEPALDDLMNYPNPFSDYTTFKIRHNQAGEELNIRVEVYSSTGQLVKRLTHLTTTDGYTYLSPRWNGISDDGQQLEGLYLYRVVVETKDGKKSDATSKLVIIR